MGRAWGEKSEKVLRGNDRNLRPTIPTKVARDFYANPIKLIALKNKKTIKKKGEGGAGEKVMFSRGL